MSAQSAADAISLPSGGGALSGIGETFQPDLQTGTGNLTVPIQVPAGRAGLTPSLSLAYSTGNGNGPFGLGWALSVPQVRRRTSHGVPSYQASDGFVLSGAEDLTPVAAGAGWVQYRPRTESGFARITHVTDPAVGDYWEVWSRDGLRSRYGTARPATPVVDGNWQDPAVIPAPGRGDAHEIFGWLLSRTVDPMGNLIDYRWSADPHGGPQRYLSEICYVDHGDPADPLFLVSIRITYVERPDPFSDRRGGFDLRTIQRATSIDTWMQDGEPVHARSVTLTYADQIGGSVDNGASLLVGIHVVGHDATTRQLLPPLEFGYTRWQPQTQKFRALNGDLPAAGLSDQGLDLVDLFGDGLPSILQLDTAGRYWRNRGNGRFDPPRPLSFAPAGAALSTPGVELADLDGDGRPEVVIATTAGTTSWPLTAAGDRVGFDPRARVTAGPTAGLFDPAVRLVDLDGDGRMDLLWAGSPMHAAFNDGRGGFRGLRPLRENAGLPALNFADPRVRLADMTGDGLSDIVLVHDRAVSYWPSLGGGRFGPCVAMGRSPHFTDAALFPGTGFDPRRMLLGDVVGDGTADIVYVGDGYVSVWLNRSGNDFADPPVVIRGTPAITGEVRLVDLDGTGVAGVLWSADAGLGRLRYAFLDLTGGVKPFLLDRVDNHSGALTQIAYATSTAYATADAAAGRRWSTTLPFPVQVVAATTTRDHFAGTELSTAYAYHDGYWDPGDREFRGFGRVEHTDTLSTTQPDPPAPAVVQPLDLLTPRTPIPIGFDAAAHGNLLRNWSFDTPSGLGPTRLEGPGDGGLSTALDWTVWNTTDTTTTTELLASTLPQGSGGSMVHVTTGAAGCGIGQTLGGPAGPFRVVASVWMFVLRGSVQIGTGEGSNFSIEATCTKTGQWTLVQAGNQRTPAEGLVVYAASSDGAEFYLDHGWVRTCDTPEGPVDSPPIRTVTWFHLGPVGPAQGNWAELDPGPAYWAEDSPLQAQIDLAALPQQPRPVLREALRGLRGRILRTELYADDGAPGLQDRPYEVHDNSFQVAPVLDGRSPDDPSWQAQPVVAVRKTLSRTTVWDRGADPMTRVKATGRYDEYGRAHASVDIGVPRGRDPRGPGQPCLATVTTIDFATRDDTTLYRLDRTSRTARHEAVDPGDSPVTTFAVSALAGEMEGDLRGLELTYYDGQKFTGLGIGELGDYGLPVRSEQLVITRERLAQACQPAVPGGAGSPVPPYLALDGTPPTPDTWSVRYPSAFQDAITTQAPPSRGNQLGYVWHSSEGPYAEGYYTQTSRLSYDIHSPQPGRRPQGLPLISRDPYGGDTTTEYDKYDLLAAVATDPVGLKTSAKYDYWVLKPAQVTDPNGNRTSIGYTPLGLPAWVARLGKDGQREGDTVEQPGLWYEYDLTAFDNSATATDSDGGTAPPRQPLSVSTIRRVDHRWTLVNRENARRAQAGEPPLTDPETAAMFGPDERDEHPDRFIRTVEFTDGLGRLLQTRTQGGELTVTDLGLPDDPTPAARTVAAAAVSGEPPVVVSGWKIYDNKGRPVLLYEPFFDTGYGYRQPDDTLLAGFARVTQHYDPRGRQVRTTAPDGSETRLVLGIPQPLSDLAGATPTPWETYTYDANDNASRTHPTSTLQLTGHWDTPTSTLVDPLGRTVRTTQRGDAGPVTAGHVFDIDGHLLSITDPLGRLTATTVYDLTGQPWRTWRLDAGATHSIRDATGAVVEHRDDKKALTLAAFDDAQRPVLGWAANWGGQEPTLRQVTVYGDDETLSGLHLAEALAMNARGRVVAIYDETGRVSTAGYDLGSNPVITTRRVLRPDLLLSLLPPAGGGDGWVETSYPVNWQPTAGQILTAKTLTAHAEVLLDPTDYQVDESFDALGRRISAVAPTDATGARAHLDYSYGRGGGISTITLDDTAYLQHAVYDAYGRRILAHLGNGILQRYRYDPQTSRLRRLRAEHATQTVVAWTGDGPVLQDYTYRYDPVGNLLTLGDRTPGCGIPPNSLGVLHRKFGYDPLYRLTSASGRETDVAPDVPWRDVPRSTDITKARLYTEDYTYDAVGNLLQLRHRTDPQGTGAYNRTFHVRPAGNQLAGVEVGALRVEHTYDPCGNLLSEATNRLFEWDHANRLATFRDQAGVQGPTMYVQYRYNDAGVRIMKLVRPSSGSDRVTIYLGSFERTLVTRSNGRRPTAHDTLHLLDGSARLVALRRGEPLPDDPMPDHPVTYTLGDHLGSVAVTTDEAGSLLNREEFAAYGETSFGSYVRKRYRFTAKERDEESGFYYHGARYYAPWLARWIACDPRGLIDGHNMYSYVRGNPLVRCDPTGTQSEPRQAESNVSDPGWYEVRDSGGEDRPVQIDIHLSGRAPSEGTTAPGTNGNSLSNGAGRVAASAQAVTEGTIWALNPFKRGQVLHMIVQNTPSNNPGFDILTGSKITELKTIGQDTRQVSSAVQRGGRQIVQKSLQSPLITAQGLQSLRKEVAVIMPPGTGGSRLAQAKGALSGSKIAQGAGVTTKVNTGLPGVGGRLLNALAPVGAVVSTMEFAGDVAKGDWESAIGSGTSAVAGALETASFVAPLVSGGITMLPPVAAVVGSFSLGWSAGSWAGQHIDRWLQPGSGWAGNWYYHTILN